MEEDPFDFPERRAKSEDEASYIKLHNRITGEKYIYTLGKFQGKKGLWKKHLEWIEFIALFKWDRAGVCGLDGNDFVVDAISKSRVWVVDEYVAPYRMPGVIYG